MSHTEPARTALSGAHLREAERGFVAMLRAKGFPAVWIDANVIDLMAQAASEYARWLTDHEPEPNPAGWLIVCAYRRAVNLLEAQRRRPPTTSLDAVYDLADEGVRTPEQQAIEHDRQERIREAMGQLPRQDRRLLAMVYFEDRSVREAGRTIGWRKSAADRHHRAALDRLRAILGEDPSLLSPAVGLAAWVSLFGEGGRGALGARALLAPIEGAAGTVAEAGRRLGELVRRLMPFAEAGQAAGAGGAGRIIGACGAGVAAAVCGLALAGVGPTLPGHTASEPSPKPAPRTGTRGGEVRPAPVEEVARDVGDSVVSKKPAHPRHRARRRSREIASRPTLASTAPARSGSEQSAPTPSPASAVTEEFGIETGGGSEPSEAPSTPPSSPTRSGGSLPEKSQPAPEATGAQVSEEFGFEGRAP
ncbi:MAG: sigma-70 family RNA polymerase sigma factor [Solirubrobacterales bacterium]